MIALISLAGRIYGPFVGGILGGLPVIMGPILAFLAVEQGSDFVAQSATAALSGMISISIFCYIFARASENYQVFACLIMSLIGFAISTVVFSFIELPPLKALITVVAFLITFLLVLPIKQDDITFYQTPKIEIFFRMVAAVLLLFIITGLAEIMGPRLSGLLAPFPIAGSVLASFTHYNSGHDATVRLLDGYMRGLFGTTAFSFVLATQINIFGIFPTLLLSALAAVLIGGLARSVELTNLRQKILRLINANK